MADHTRSSTPPPPRPAPPAEDEHTLRTVTGPDTAPSMEEEDATFIELPSDEPAPAPGTSDSHSVASDDVATFIEAHHDPTDDATFIEPGGRPAADTDATLIGAPDQTDPSATGAATGPSGDADDRTMIQPDDLSRSPEISSPLNVGEASADESDPFSQTMVSSEISQGDDHTVIAPDDAEEGSASGTDFALKSTDPEDKTFVTDAGSEPTGVVVSTEEPRRLPSANKDHPRIGKFEIRKLLGQGAFGAVYLAYDPQLDRLCAVKVAKTGVLSGKEDVDRFMREARSAAQLRHPHIVPVYEVGHLTNTNFIAYEYVEGTTLGSRLKEQKSFPPEVAVTYMRKIAEALHYAHSLGIVHRDMKPDNVLLDLHDEPHVADFGLARRDDADTNRTREGLFMGTPSYMSPEQASGQAHLADARSDVWSLGIMLQEMLTGVKPFRGNVTEVILAVQNQEAPALRQINKELPQDLETIVQKCLTKDKTKRFQSAQEFADELERWQRGEPILSRPISTWERTRLWAKRNPTVAKLIGAVLATFFLGFTLSTYFGVRARQNLTQFRIAKAERAVGQLDTIQTAVPGTVPTLVANLMPDREDVRDTLQQRIAADDLPDDQRARLLLCHSALFAAPGSAAAEDNAVQVLPRLMTSGPDELLMLADLIRQQSASSMLEGELWRVAQTDGRDRDRFQALVALAALHSQLPDWPAASGDLVAGLLALDDLELPAWLPAFSSVQQELLPELSRFFRTGEKPDSRRRAAILLGNLFRDRPASLVPLVKDADPEQLPPLIEAFRPQSAQVVPLLEQELQEVLAIAPPERRLDSESEQAALIGMALIALKEENAGAADSIGTVLVALDHGDQAWPLLGPSINPHARTWIIHRAAAASLDWKRLAQPLNPESDPMVIAAVCLALGEYGLADLPASGRSQLTPHLMKLFRTHPHAGVHSAAEWTLRKWGHGEELDELTLRLRSRERPPGFDWHVDEQGVTFAIVEGPKEFLMGATLDDPQQTDYELQHRRLIPRTFGIAMREVTVREFLRFRENHEYNPLASPEPDCPISDITWFQAAQYCRWFSEQGDFGPEDMCFPPIEEIGPRSVALPVDCLDRSGYRLPTEAEWECAARAGTQTIRPFGNSDQFLPQYAWYQRNSGNRSHPVGLLKPNDWGLFDVHGNMLEWCQDWYFDDFPEPNADGVVVDGLVDEANGVYRNLRGVEYIESDQNMRISFRDYEEPFIESYVVGFRLARTYPPAP